MRALIVALLLLPFLAQAAAPTLSGNGSTGTFNHGTVPLNVGSPSAGDLMVVVATCSQETNTTAAVITPPAGWTTETTATSADTFYMQKLMWKVATGSEGATEDFTFPSGGNCNIGSWYWVFAAGTFNAADPVDATDIAWNTTGTLNPPSQTFASGPRDGYVLAFASTRGDNTYSSGSDLTTNAHADGGGDDVARTVAVSYGAYTSTSSKDPGSFVFSGTARPSSALTAVVYGVSAPAYTVDPALSARTTSSISITQTTACTDCTAYFVAETDGLGTPSCTQIKAGNGADGNAAYKATSGAITTGVELTLTLSSYTNGAVRDGYGCLNSTGGGDGPVAAVADMYKIPAFTTPLSVASQTDTIFTSNSKVLDGAGTVHWVRCPAGGTAPMVTQVEAHGGACITDGNTDDATGTMTLTVASRTPNNDLYYVGTYGSQHEAAVHTLANEFLDAPVGYGQIVMAAGPYQVPCLDYNLLYSPVIATNTVLEFPLAATSGNAAVGNLTVANDCTTQFDPGGDLTRRGFENWKIYTGGSSLNTDDIDAWFYDPNIVRPANSTPPDPRTILVQKTGLAVGTAPNPAIIVWDTTTSDPRLCYHPLEDAVTVTITSGTLPTGLAQSGTGDGLITGTVAGANENESGAALTFRCTSDVTGGFGDFDAVVYPITTWTLPNCTGIPTDILDCKAAILTLTQNSVTVNTSGAGNVTVMSPILALGEIAPYTTETLTGVQTAPNCLLQTVASCRILVTLVSTLATFNASTGCATDASVIYTQGPAAYSAISDVTMFVLTAFCR